MAGVSLSIDLLDNLTAPLMSKLNTIDSRLSSLGSGVGDAGLGNISSAADDLMGKLAGVAGGILSIGTAISSINAADAMRDLSNSIDAVSQSLGTGAQAIAVFQTAAQGTRATATQLTTIFRDDLPAAMRRGFDPSQFQNFTATLADAATALGVTIDEVSDSYRRLLSQSGSGIGGAGGGGAGGGARNVLVSALGISPSDFTSYTDFLDAVNSRLTQLAQTGAGMGQTFESSFSHVKDALETALGQGIEDGIGGWQKFQDALTDPKIIEAIHDIGQAIGDAFSNFLPVIQALAALANGQTLSQVLGDADVSVKVQNPLGAPLPADYSEFGTPTSTVGIVAPPSASTETPAYLGPPGAPGTSTSSVDDILNGGLLSGSTATSSVDGIASAIDGLNVKMQPTPEELKKISDGLLEVKTAADQVQSSIDQAFEAIDRDSQKTTNPFETIINSYTAPMDQLAQKLSDEYDKLQDQIAKFQTANPGVSVAPLTAELGALQGAISAAYGQETQDQINGFDAAQLKLTTDVGSAEDGFASFSAKVAAFASGDGDQLNQKLLSIDQTTTDLVNNATKLALQYNNMADQADAAGFPQQAQVLRDIANSYDSMVPKIQAAGVAQAAAALGAKDWSVALEQASKLVDGLKSDLTDAFADLLSPTSLDNLGSDLTKLFGDVAKQFGTDLATSVLTVLGVGQKPVQGQPSTFGVDAAGQSYSSLISAGVLTPDQAYQESTANYLNSSQGIKQILAIAQAGQAVYQLATTPGTSIGQGAITGAAAGAAVGLSLTATATSIGTAAGGYIGAIVGLIVGGVAAALSPSANYASKQYLDLSIQNGQAVNGGVDPGVLQERNIDPSTVQALLAQIQSTIDSLTDGVVKIFASLPASLADKLLSEITPLNENDIQLGWNSAPSSNFMAALDAWIKTGLPGQIMSSLWDPMAQALSSLGMGSAQIAAVRSYMDSIDPTQALTYFGTLVGAMQTFQEQWKTLNESAAQATADATLTGLPALMNSLKSTIGDMDSIQEEFSHLSLGGQADALAQFGTDLTTVNQAFSQFFAEIAGDKQQIDALFQGSETSYAVKLDAGNPAAQVGLLMKEFSSDISQIQSSLDPNQVASLSSSINGVINQIASIGENISPAMATAYDNWAEEALKFSNSIADAQLASIQNQAQDERDKLIKAFGDLQAAVEANTVALTPPTGGNSTSTPGNVGQGTDPDPNQLAGNPGVNKGWDPDQNYALAGGDSVATMPWQLYENGGVSSSSTTGIPPAPTIPDSVNTIDWQQYFADPFAALKANSDTFFETQSNSFSTIMGQAQDLAGLTGTDLTSALEGLNTSLGSLYSNLLQYIQSLQSVSTSLNGDGTGGGSFGSAFSALYLQNAAGYGSQPNTAGEIAYLKQALQGAEGGAESSTDPNAIASYTQEAIGYIQQIGQLMGGAAGNTWAVNQLGTFQKSVNSWIASLGTQATNQESSFANQLAPLLAAYTVQTPAIVANTAAVVALTGAYTNTSSGSLVVGGGGSGGGLAPNAKGGAGNSGGSSTATDISNLLAVERQSLSALLMIVDLLEAGAIVQVQVQVPEGDTVAYRVVSSRAQGV